MQEFPACPQCAGTQVYDNGDHVWTCPECWYDFTQADLDRAQEAAIVRDANGNPIQDGDDLIVTQDIKLGKDTIKRGTKAKQVRVLETPVDGHELECTIDGVGRIYILAKYVKR